jgi:hypothetical protein
LGGGGGLEKISEFLLEGEVIACEESDTEK